LYVVRTGCAWWYLPADFPPWQTCTGIWFIVTDTLGLLIVVVVLTAKRPGP
jgi:hypothetical protein